MVVLGLLFGVCATANAQEAGQVGITMGYPGSGEIGAGYSRSTSSTTTVIIPIVLPPGLEPPARPTTTSTLTGFSTRTGVGVIFYIK